MTTPEKLSFADFAATDATHRANVDDAKWFARHKKRCFRIRPVVSGEVPSPATHMLIARPEPGVMVSKSFASDESVENTEILGECLWQQWGNPPLSKHGEAIFLIRAEAEGNA